MIVSYLSSLCLFSVYTSCSFSSAVLPSDLLSSFSPDFFHSHYLFLTTHSFFSSDPLSSFRFFSFSVFSWVLLFHFYFCLACLNVVTLCLVIEFPLHHCQPPSCRSLSHAYCIMPFVAAFCSFCPSLPLLFVCAVTALRPLFHCPSHVRHAPFTCDGAVTNPIG